VTQDTAEGSKPDADVEAPSLPSAPDSKDASPAGEQPTAAQTAQQRKAPAEAKSLPYSIYLGSFRKEEALQQALAIYRESGLSPYVVRMDLGSKGVWLRVFSGHFETREEADAFIKKNQISEAETKHTRYAVLVGEFSWKQDAEARAKVLKDSGCHPYVIGVNPSSLRVYSGAYYRMEDAEKELAWLASKGVKGRIVER
jgi:cell division septation protein DedD